MASPRFEKHRSWLNSDKPMARIVRNMLWLTSSKGLGAVLSLIYLGIATRSLGVEGFGRFALVLSIGATIATIVQFDCWRAILRFGPHYMHEGHLDRLGSLIALSRLFEVGAALIGCIVAAAIFYALDHFFGWNGEISLMGFLYCCAQLLSLRSTPAGLIRLHDRFDLGAYADMLTPIARMTGALVVMLAFHSSVEAFLIVWAASEIVTAISYWAIALRIDAPSLALRHQSGIRALIREEKELFSFLGSLNIALTLTGAIRQAPVLVLGAFVSPAAAGLFRLGFQLVTALAKVANLLTRAAYAEFNHARARGGHLAVRKLLGQTNRVMMIAAAMMTIVTITLGKPILLVISGPGFVGAYPLLVILGLSVSVDFIGLNYEPALLSTTDGKVVLRIRIALAAVLLISLWFLASWHGAEGAALSMLLTSVAGLLLFVLAGRRHLHRAPIVAQENSSATISIPSTD
jgi:O-antigen/teichoic acid export membrane protein